MKSIETMNEEQRAASLKELKSMAERNPELTAMIHQLETLVHNPGGEPEPGFGKELKEAGFSDGDLCEILDIQKAWHGVHFLLCGEADCQTLLGQVVLGGREIGENVGYGPARFLEPSEVQEISARLAKVGTGEMRMNFDPVKMNSQGIYPGNWDEDKRGGNWEWLLDAYLQVKDYYRLAAEKGFAMLQFLT
jgi:hypothetical protein